MDTLILYELDKLKERALLVEPLDFQALSRLRRELEQIISTRVEHPEVILEKLRQISFSPLLIGAEKENRLKAWESGLDELAGLFLTIEGELKVIDFLDNRTEAPLEHVGPDRVIISALTESADLDSLHVQVTDSSLIPVRIKLEKDSDVLELISGSDPVCAILLAEVKDHGSLPHRINVSASGNMISRFSFWTGLFRGKLGPENTLVLLNTDGSIRFPLELEKKGINTYLEKEKCMEKAWSFLSNYRQTDWFYSNAMNVSDSIPNMSS